MNLKKFNDHTVYEKFKMEGMGTVRELVRPEDWAGKVDMRKAYLHCQSKTNPKNTSSSAGGKKGGSLSVSRSDYKKLHEFSQKS